MNNSKNPSSVRSKKWITEALLSLMEKQEYKKITVKDIAEKADVVRKTFYRNFESKDDVLNAYISSIISEYTQNIIETEPLTPYTLFLMIFRLCLKYKDFCLTLRKNNMFYLILEKWNDALPFIHQKGIEHNKTMCKFFERADIKYVMAFNAGGTWNIIQSWIDGNMKESPEELAEKISKYFCLFM